MRVLAILLALIPAPALGQSCPGDVNGDRVVTVNELIAGVNSALNGCGGAAPTPTRTATPVPDACPFRFNQAVSSDQACAYSGTADGSCGNFGDVASSWITLGTEVIAIMVDRSGSLAISARRASPTSATVYEIAPGPDFTNTMPTTGTLSLPAADRFRASIRSTNCGTVVHDGAFIGVLDGDAARVAGRMSLTRAVVGDPVPTDEGRAALFRELYGKLVHR